MLKSKLERKNQMSAVETKKPDLKVGTILHGSWGYDQTNPEFFEVVERPSPHYAVVRRLEAESVRGEEGFMSDRVVPIPGKWHKWDGKPVRKRIKVGDWRGNPTPHLTFKHFSAYPVETDREYYRSWYA